MAKRKTEVFRPGDLVVYPAHGVGRIISVEEQDLYGVIVEMFVLHMERNRLTVMVPTDRVRPSGMRSLSDPALAERAMVTVSGRSRAKKGIWSRRATEYERKIRSGDLLLAAEVVRDLRGGVDTGGSYSERQLYELALDRVTREVAAVLGTDQAAIRARIETSQSRRAA